MRKIKRCIFKKIFEDKPILNSFFILIIFYIIFLIGYYLFGTSFANYSLLKTLFWIWLGNLIIAIITQLIHLFNYLKDEQEKEEKETKQLFYEDFIDCLIRCSGGIFEMCFYVIFFALGRWEIIAGYLVMKGLSIWKPNEKGPRNIVKEGISTTGLRIAVVLSLIFALFASHYFNLFLYEQGFLLNQYELFIK